MAMAAPVHLTWRDLRGNAKHRTPTVVRRAPDSADAVLGPAPPERGVHRDHIVREEAVRIASLDPTQRSALFEKLFAVYSATTGGLTYEQLEAAIFGGQTQILLMYGETGELIGFAYVWVERIGHAGRRCAVFFGGASCLLGYQPGSRVMRNLLQVAVRFKIQEPRTPLAFLTRSSSPAAYRMLASAMPRVYPNRAFQTPPDVEAMMRALSLDPPTYCPEVGC